MNKRIIALAASLFAISSGALAEVSSLAWIAEGCFFLGKPSAVGASAAGSALLKPFEDHDLLLGPKLGVLVAGAENGSTRFDLNWGLSEVLWIVNAFGGGVDLQVVAPSTITGEESAVHFRVVPNLAIRLVRFGEQGAWAVRVAAPYDTHYKWGLEVGVTLQLSGVTQRGL